VNPGTSILINECLEWNSQLATISQQIAVMLSDLRWPGIKIELRILIEFAHLFAGELTRHVAPAQRVIASSGSTPASITVTGNPAFFSS
jgi:transcriptional regulator of acetoin/glycerol metabolism